jgi:S4 domain
MPGGTGLHKRYNSGKQAFRARIGLRLQPLPRCPHCLSSSSGQATATARAATAQKRGAQAEGIRINKCLKHKHSRRQVDAMVAEGRIKINQRMAQPGDRVFPGDVVTCDGAHVHWELMNSVPSASGEFVYVKYWKPVGVVCTTDESVPWNIVDQVRLLHGPQLRTMASAWCSVGTANAKY